MGGGAAMHSVVVCLMESMLVLEILQITMHNIIILQLQECNTYVCM